MKTIKKILVVGALISGAALFAAQEVDGIVAQVGEISILRSEVTGEMRRAGLRSEADFNNVLNRIIERKLILKAAQDAKMSMQEWVVDNRVREITENAFDGDRNKLMAALASEKLPYPEFRQRIKDDLVVSAMRWNVVDKYVTASPAEMRAEYKAHPERYTEGDTVSVSVILLKPGEEEKRAVVEEALKTNSFADVAREYSADTHAKDGGLWKDIRPEEIFREEICAAIAILGKDAVSPWVDIDGWSFLIKKDSEAGAKIKSFKAAYEDIEANIKTAKAKELYTRWIDLLKKETYIKIYE